MSHCLACRRANQILGALTAPARLYSQVDAPEWKQAPWACRTDQAGVAVFVQDDLPIAALESIECEIYLVHGQIGDAARSEHDDLLSLISASAGSQTDVLRVGGDDELQRQQQLLVCLKTPESFQFVGEFGGQMGVVEPGTDQAFIDVLDIGLVVRL